MFSGIKSMLFGYSEPDAESTNEVSTSNAKDTTDKLNDTSATSFEQTLNAATTKLTEQLLPQSASIEELQSSSHQLLPSFNEQLEQEKRLKEAASESNSSKQDIKIDVSENEDCIDADSWELLDLVEKPEVDAGELELTVQVEEEIVIEKSNNGGILKQGHKKAKDEGARSCKEQRVKPKVSFETPDLVNKGAVEKIDIITKIGADEKGSANNEIKASKKSKKLKKAANKTAPSSTEKQQSTATDIEKVGENVALEDQASKATKIRMQPVVSKLNYAAALAAKPIKEGGQMCSASQVSALTQTDNSVIMQTSTAVKRTRPVSTSSCSSSDEIETVEVDEPKIAEAFKISDAPTSNLKPKTSGANEDVFDTVDDDESLISSGFSDCDYGYDGLNDYIMRPKKTQRRRNTSTSSAKSIVSSVSRNGSTKGLASGSSKPSVETFKSGTVKSATVVVALHSSKHLKPKKKKLVVQQSSDRKQSALTRNDRKRCVSESKGGDEKVDRSSCKFLKTKTGENGASNNCSNESSDIAEMDESWYVTPPPCFTGVKVKPQAEVSGEQSASVITKEAEAERENSLIEHPSIYIASTSKQILIEKALTDTASVVVPDESTSIKSKRIVLKRKHKVSESKSEVIEEVKPQPTKEVAVPLLRTDTVTKCPAKVTPKVASKPAPKSTTSVPLGKPLNNQKAWENKFVVTSWDDDEQDDIDFDNVFDYAQDVRSTSPKSSSKSKCSRKQTKSAAKKKVQPASSEEDSFDSDDVSISSPALDGVTRYSESPSGSSQQAEDDATENKKPCESNIGKIGRGSTAGRKPPTLVKPIEPERRPGWQLRRMRSKRHPLSSSTTNSAAPPASVKLLPTGCMDEHIGAIATPKVKGDNKRNRLISLRASDHSSTTETESSASSARSTPTLIDRIGSSIVANLSNLTSGLVASTALPPGYALQHCSSNGSGRASASDSSGSSSSGSQTSAAATIGGGGRALVAAMAKSAARGVERSLVVERKRMSKGYLKRANNCASYERQRSDRRTRMSRVPNGCSVDRKVHSNFH